MSDYQPYQPCHGCGLGKFIPGSKAFGIHFHSCKKPLLKSNDSEQTTNLKPTNTSHPNEQHTSKHKDPTIYKFEVDNLGNPIYKRNALETHSSQCFNSPFVFDNNDEDRWELNNDTVPPITETITEPTNIHEMTTEPIPPPETTLKLPFKKDVILNNGLFSFQIDLMDILQRHKTNLILHDEIVDLVSLYLRTGKLNSKQSDLVHRKAFIKQVEESFQIKGLKPKHENVELSDGRKATISLFDIEYMILSLLTDESLMQDSNIAEGYNVFTGEVDDNHPHNKNYGEVHTGDAWKPAMKHFCGDNGEYMPISLIIFGDKTYTDLHGSLSVTPIIFTLSLFNSSSRNNPSFWRPLAYIPNLSHGRAKSDKTQPQVKVQDEHKCLALAFRSLRDLHNSGRGLKMVVKGKFVTGKVWIHYFIGDTAGNNTWLGHYNGSGQLKRPYRDCTCCFGAMSNPNPQCTYITLDDMRETKRRKLNANSKKKKDEIFQVISKHDIRNALTEPDLPLSDQVHGPYRMMPPELLHVSGSGLIMYMFSSLTLLLTTACSIILDALHQTISNDISRQSEKDFPRGSVRNGILDGTKCQSSERRGNLFRLLCIAHTEEGIQALSGSWAILGITQTRFCTFIMLYLAMEEWMHSENKKEKVRAAQKLVAKILRMLKKIFPRATGNGHRIPKFHGMTKMLTYMRLFGSALNFFGGPGESHHRYFVKAPGDNTQRRVSEFAKQVSNRVYESMIFEIAKEALNTKNDSFELVGENSQTGDESNVAHDEETNAFIGAYQLKISAVNEDGVSGECEIKWKSENKKKKKEGMYQLHPDLLRVIYRETKKKNLTSTTITGYTELRTKCDKLPCTFHAHPWFGGSPWYDWAYVEFAEKGSNSDVRQKYYPSLILGFIQFSDDTDVHAVIRTATKELPWEMHTKKFISSFLLSNDFEKNYKVVPVSSIVLPMMAFQDYGGVPNQFFTSLPKRNWAQYFDRQIDVDIQPNGEVDSGEEDGCDGEYEMEGTTLDDENYFEGVIDQSDDEMNEAEI